MAHPAADDIQQAALDEFGEDIIYTPVGQQPLPLRGVFRSAHAELELETNTRVSTNEPVLGIRIADLAPRLAQVNDVVTVRGLDWNVVDVQPDGEGWQLLLLNDPKRV